MQLGLLLREGVRRRGQIAREPRLPPFEHVQREVIAEKKSSSAPQNQKLLLNARARS